MVAVITDDKKFAVRCCNILKRIGVLPIHFKHQFAKRALHCGARAAIIHAGKDLAVAQVSCTALRKSDFKNKPIITVVRRNVSGEAKYMEIDGSTEQIKLPCLDSDISDAVYAVMDVKISYGRLVLGGNTRCVDFLAYPLKLSDKEYSLLRFIVLENGGPVIRRQLSYWMRGMSNNCMSVHFSSINKKAYEISGRKLVMFEEDAYYLNPYM